MTPKEKQELDRVQRENDSLRQTVASLQKSISDLQEQLRETIEGNADMKKQLSGLQNRLDRVLQQLEKKNKKEFGKKTERHNPRHISGGESESDDFEAEQFDPNRNPSQKSKNKRNHKKNINDQDLPDVIIKHNVKPEDQICPSCLIETKVVGHKLSKQLESLQQSLVRLQHQQEVRSCPKCHEHIITAQKPEPPFPGSLAGPHLLADIIVNKLANGLPNYRQHKMFRRQLCIVPRSTQCDWMIAASMTLQPLYDLLLKCVLQSKVIKTDDTWVKIQDRSRPGNIRKGKMTPYLGDKQHPFTVFDFSPNQSFERNKKMLEDFVGCVQVDAATGFDALFTDGTRVELGCNAHSRRRADEAESAEPEAAGEILDIYSAVYKLEEQIQDKEPAQRLATRQTKSKPLMQKLHQNLLKLDQVLNPTNPLKSGVEYMLRHWIALTRFLDDPDFDIDNNASERAIKLFVLVRKNSLFVGSDAGGRAAAIHLSFIASCERNNIDPVAYLTDVFSRINSMKTSELEQLLPDRWTAPRSSPP